MDGVLLDTERLIFEMFKKSADYHGFRFPEEKFPETIGLDTGKTRVILEKHIPMDYDKFAKREEFFVEHLTNVGAPVIENVEEGLKKIKSAGMKIALATSTGKKRAYFRLEKTNFLSYIDQFAFGDEWKIANDKK
jgi:beta-phosphoglucomutase-like phosphatase (HAD superfamily)